MPESGERGDLSRRVSIVLRISAFLAVTAVSVLPMAAAYGSATEPLGSIPWLLTAQGDKNSTVKECSLGSVVADASRIYLGTDIAIICGGDLTGDLPPGDITRDELISVFAQDRVLATATVTINELRLMLESGVSYIKLDETEKIDEELSSFDGFPQISGFALYYDASFPEGERVYDILIDGERVDLYDQERILTIAASKYMLEGGYGYPAANNVIVSDMALSDATARYISDGITGFTTSEKRIHVRGEFSGGLSAYVPIQILPIMILLFLVAYASRNKRKADKEDRKSTPWY